MNEYSGKVKGLIDGKIQKESVGSIIADVLLKGRNVVIPGLGYLELKPLSNRYAVLFRAAKSEAEMESTQHFFGGYEKEEFLSLIYHFVSAPLMEGKVVSWPELGFFHPIKNEDGSLRISFTPSNSFRKQVSGVNFLVNEELNKILSNDEVKTIGEIKKVEEIKRLEEVRKIEEEAKKIKEEAKRLETKKIEEEARKIEEEAKRIEEEEAKRQETKRLEEEAKRIEEEEAKRLEAKWLEEEAKRLEEEAKRLEAKRLEEEEARRREEAKKLEEEEAKRLEAKRLEEEARRLEEEAKKLEEEEIKRREEEAKRIEAKKREEEIKKFEAKRLEEIKKIEEAKSKKEEIKKKEEPEIIIAAKKTEETTAPIIEKTKVEKPKELSSEELERLLFEDSKKTFASKEPEKIAGEEKTEKVEEDEWVEYTPFFKTRQAKQTIRDHESEEIEEVEEELPVDLEIKKWREERNNKYREPEVKIEFSKPADQKVINKTKERKGKNEKDEKRTVHLRAKNDSKRWNRSALGFMMLFVAVIIALGMMVKIFSSKEKNKSTNLEQQQVVGSLPYLAEQNYGNPAFWVYIYEANRDKLTSPINIPAKIELEIPDLSEYNVDVKDSLEIKRAKVMSDMILKQKY
ncbi:MAG: hypothetical protein FWF52_10180 [Candidatus Azobacteroides sp.]|nr:hypothetical protein [Candidatus Azobacteroides sp.]